MQSRGVGKGRGGGFEHARAPAVGGVDNGRALHLPRGERGTTRFGATTQSQELAAAHRGQSLARQGLAGGQGLEKQRIVHRPVQPGPVGLVLQRPLADQHVGLHSGSSRDETVGRYTAAAVASRRDCSRPGACRPMAGGRRAGTPNDLEDAPPNQSISPPRKHT